MVGGGCSPLPVLLRLYFIFQEFIVLKNDKIFLSFFFPFQVGKQGAW